MEIEDNYRAGNRTKGFNADQYIFNTNGAPVLLGMSADEWSFPVI